MSNLSELLNWLAGAGSLALVAWFISWALEGWGKWEALSSRVKSAVILGFSILLGLVTTVLKGLPPEVLAAIEPYVQTVVAIIGAWLATQTAHRLNPFRKGY